MLVLWKKIAFYKGKSDCKAIVIAAWGLRWSLGGISGRKAPKIFHFLMPLRWLNSLQRHWKTILMAPKKLYQLIPSLFFLANIPTPSQVHQQVDKNFTSSYFGIWSTGFRERYLPLKYYICKEIHINKHAKTSVVRCTCKRNKHNFCFNIFFSFKIKLQDFNV